MASAQTPTTSSPPNPDSPVAQVRNNKSWEYGPFVNYGNGLGNRDNFYFFRAGFQVGKPISRVLKAGIFTGQFEFGANIMPLWQAYTPAPHEESAICSEPNGQTEPCELPVWRRNLSWRQSYTRDLPVEFSYQVQADSALVSGCRRIDLHHT